MSAASEASGPLPLRSLLAGTGRVARTIFILGVPPFLREGPDEQLGA